MSLNKKNVFPNFNDTERSTKGIFLSSIDKNNRFCLDDCMMIKNMQQKEDVGKNVEIKLKRTSLEDLSRWFLHPYHASFLYPDEAMTNIENDVKSKRNDRICYCGFKKSLVLTDYDAEIMKKSLHNQKYFSMKPEFHPNSPNTFLLSAFEHRISLIKLQQLKEEEKEILHLRRLLELDRIRPPVPYWYEKKDRHFHDEVHRLNFIMKYPEVWNHYLRIRNESECMVTSSENKKNNIKEL
ncbi:uncharacterized protein [Centruroides vittatus]|uniref:uncharacterized protein n=1 Tax=Centruroides vittatus TaxID=120091 RepID=UPI00350FB26F